LNQPVRGSIHRTKKFRRQEITNVASVRDFARTSDGLKLRYEIRGDGDPLALIIGFSASGRGWGDPFLKLMEARFKTFIIDNRGTGESDKPDAEFTSPTWRRTSRPCSITRRRRARIFSASRWAG